MGKRLTVTLICITAACTLFVFLRNCDYSNVQQDTSRADQKRLCAIVDMIKQGEILAPSPSDISFLLDYAIKLDATTSTGTCSISATSYGRKCVEELKYSLYIEFDDGESEYYTAEVPLRGYTQSTYSLSGIDCITINAITVNGTTVDIPDVAVYRLNDSKGDSKSVPLR